MKTRKDEVKHFRVLFNSDLNRVQILGRALQTVLYILTMKLQHLPILVMNNTQPT